jgi:hypothetical protein
VYASAENVWVGKLSYFDSRAVFVLYRIDASPESQCVSESQGVLERRSALQGR